MAFIREYGIEGDPFLGRVFKKLRKVKVGRFLGKAAKAPFKLAAKVAPVASFLPIPGAGLLGRLISIGRRYQIPDENVMEFARTYGVSDEGDPFDDDTEESGLGITGYMGDDLGLEYMGDPGAPKPARKRKTAGSGPRVKAQKKKAKRKERAARKGESFASKVGKSLGTGAKAVGAALPDLLAALKSGGPLGGMAHMATAGPGGANAEDAALAEMMAAMGGKKPKGAAGFRFGAKRRTMNPANVKALRRGIRRVEGFQKLVKRVNKMFPALRGPTTMRSSPRRARGHRAGCGCVVCKRAA